VPYHNLCERKKKSSNVKGKSSNKLREKKDIYAILVDYHDRSKKKKGGSYFCEKKQQNSTAEETWLKKEGRLYKNNKSPYLSKHSEERGTWVDQGKGKKKSPQAKMLITKMKNKIGAKRERQHTTHTDRKKKKRKNKKQMDRDIAPRGKKKKKRKHPLTVSVAELQGKEG